MRTIAAQRVHVQVVEDLVQQYEAVGVLTYFTEAAFDEVLPNKVRCMGMGQGRWTTMPSSPRSRNSPRRILILHLLNGKVLQWAVEHPQVRSMVLCAETRQTRHPLHWWRNRKLARLLNSEQLEWACNHQTNAARWMEKIGVSADKIIPWDFRVRGHAG